MVSPHEQYQRPPHARRHRDGYSEVGSGKRPLHLQLSSNEFALEDDITDPALQSYNPQSFYQSASRPVNGVSSIDPAISEGHPPHTWQQERSTEWEQSWDQRYLTSAAMQDAPNYEMNAFAASNDRHTNSGYPLEQDGTSMVINNRPRNRETSSTTFSAFTGSPMQNSNYLQQANAVVDSRTYQNMRLPGRGTNHHDPRFLSPRQFDPTFFAVYPQQEPWSVYHPADGYHESGFLEEAPEPDVQETPDMALSMTDYTSENLNDSVVTERPAAGYPEYVDPVHSLHYSLPCGPPPIQIDIERSATPSETPSTTQGSSQWELGSLGVPMQRSRSTRSSVSDASSTGPPTFTPEVMYCNVGDCSRAFRGLYRRGNLGRHKRQKHREGQAYVCDDNTCAKEFQRQDARLKHYRKYHPELAADSPLVRRSSASRPTRRNQEVELSNISSWAT